MHSSRSLERSLDESPPRLVTSLYRGSFLLFQCPASMVVAAAASLVYKQMANLSSLPSLLFFRTKHANVNMFGLDNSMLPLYSCLFDWIEKRVVMDLSCCTTGLLQGSRHLVYYLNEGFKAAGLCIYIYMLTCMQ